MTRMSLKVGAKKREMSLLRRKRETGCELEAYLLYCTFLLNIDPKGETEGDRNGIYDGKVVYKKGKTKSNGIDNKRGN